MSEDPTPAAAGGVVHRRAIPAVCGLLLIVAAPFAYMGMISNPLARSSGWPTFVLTSAGASLLLWSVAADHRRRVVVATIFGLALSVFYVWGFLGMARLPESGRFAALEVAPSFSLPAHDGTNVSLDELTADGPALLVFYRGHW